ncbi:hypothetical protein SAMN04487969_11798 [Paenibacillus algorifonticola]|uniref:Uncharacterized protein n=1 Tax=Paenibacillus algorifonticola TaxID=684063 RepID=A0A1I2GS10_9BACL|nr:hypothetical protein SAMN04487969_11798 [Paenibacillus algorifonticola]
MMKMKLYHYYDESTGPFRNLSALEPQEAEKVLQQIRSQKRGFASKRSTDYLEIRRMLEWKTRELFVVKGGKPLQNYPHYMTLGECPWLLDWYPQGKVIPFSISDFEPGILSFTYGDLFPAMRYNDGKPYRGQVYTLSEIADIIKTFGLPQTWNAQGDKGPERYIEVQVWDDTLIRPYYS